MAKNEVGTAAVEAAPVESEMSAREAEANLVLRNYMIGAMAVGVVPIPLFDLAGISAVQMKMLHSLAKTYNLPFTSEIGKSVLASLVGAIGAEAGARLLTWSATKIIPGLGSLVGAVAFPISAGATTYAVGKIFIQHFESGGTFLTFNPTAVKTYFASLYKEGLALATQMKTEQPKVKSI